LTILDRLGLAHHSGPLQRVVTVTIRVKGTCREHRIVPGFQPVLLGDIDAALPQTLIKPTLLLIHYIQGVAAVGEKDPVAYADAPKLAVQSV